MNDLGCKSVIRGSMTGKPSLLLVEIDGNWQHAPTLVVVVLSSNTLAI